MEQGRIGVVRDFSELIACKDSVNYESKIKIAKVTNGFIVEEEPCLPTYIFKTLDEVLTHLLKVFERRSEEISSIYPLYGEVKILRGNKCC